MKSLLKKLFYTPEHGSPEHIYQMYQYLQNTPSGSRHARAYYALQDLVRQNEDSLLELLFSGNLSERELLDLMWFGKEHSGSCRAWDSPHWQRFINRVKTRSDELPSVVQMNLDWHIDTHGW